ncbi:hypothetical protein GCM10027589_00370 [Actinocorallia lasiicapitis]
MGRLHASLADLDKAFAILGDLLPDAESVLGPNDPFTESVRNLLARVEQARGQR